jgi:thiol-disulfide isomerase/thioredoxin
MEDADSQTSDDGACAPPNLDVNVSPIEDVPSQMDQGASSSPYQGGWPFNPNKSEIADPGWESVPAEGTIFPHFIAVDQYGDMVDIYDYAGQGKLVVIDMGTIYCAPCKGMAAYFATGDPCHMAPYAWWKDSYEVVLDMIESGEILWVTILFSKGGPTTQQVVHGWHEEFPSEHIAVLADTNAELAYYLDVTAMPHIMVLDENMEMIIYNIKGPTAGMNYLINLNQ